MLDSTEPYAESGSQEVTAPHSQVVAASSAIRRPDSVYRLARRVTSDFPSLSSSRSSIVTLGQTHEISTPSDGSTESGIELESLNFDRYDATLRGEFVDGSPIVAPGDAEPSAFRYSWEGTSNELETIVIPVIGVRRSTKPESFLSRIWRTHIEMEVPWESARDHLALERTYLAYYRTSMQLALASVIVSQLFILNHSANPHPSFGYHVLGRPLAATLASLAIAVAVMGWVRWWRWQRTLLRGKALVGGADITSMAILWGLLLVVLFGLMLAVGITKVIKHRRKV